jgi:TPR repeat protein
MAEGVAQTNPSNEGQRDRKAVRAAVVAAARAVAEREGVENVSLSKVAVEAGLQRAVVYQQFTRKEDLLMSIVSDDLATLARAMRDIDWAPNDGAETPETAVILSMPRQTEAEATPTEKPAEMINMAKDISTALAAKPAPAGETAPPSGAPSERKLARRAELMRVLETKDETAAVDDEAKPTTESEAAGEKTAPRAPDAWLERRLREFERAMTAMQNRYEQIEKTGRSAAVAAEEHIKTLEATIKELTERADGAEARLKVSSSEVRAALNETALRIQTVEGVARAALAENNTPEAPVELAAEPVAEPAIAETPAVAVEAAEDAELDLKVRKGDTLPKSVIAEMRRSAIAASAAAATAEAATKEKGDKERRAKTRYIVAGAIVLLVFVVAAGIAFSKGIYDGRREAMNRLVHIEPVRLAAVAPHHIVTGHQTALDQLTTRAQFGDAAAELTVGTKYLNGADTVKNPAAAMHWLTLAAVHGQPVAQYLLGTLYQQGVGAPADAAKALQWFEAAALQGNRRAMHNLGIAYAQGQGTAQNLPEAVRWFSRAAAMGYVDSQFNLAVLYERGEGVPQSLLDAYKWYTVASRRGDAESKQRVDALRTQLNADDLAAAQHAADAFRSLPYDDAANVAPAG